MSDSLPPHTGEGTIARASWVRLPDASWWTTWKNNNIEFWELLEGSYLGLNGNPIFDTNGRCIYGETPGQIVACDPGIRKISRNISNIFCGKILALLDASGTPIRSVTFPEAVNEGWLEEKTYPGAWRYVGVEPPVLNPVQEELIQRGIVPKEVYQITKLGAGKIDITDPENHRTSIQHSSGLRLRF